MKACLKKSSLIDRTPWLNVIARALIASVGGYVLACSVAAALTLTLDIPRFDVVTWALISAFTVQAGCSIYVFAAATVARALSGLVVVTAPMMMYIIVQSGEVLNEL